MTKTSVPHEYYAVIPNTTAISAIGFVEDDEGDIKDYPVPVVAWKVYTDDRAYLDQHDYAKPILLDQGYQQAENTCFCLKTEDGPGSCQADKFTYRFPDENFFNDATEASAFAREVIAQKKKKAAQVRP